MTHLRSFFFLFATFVCLSAPLLAENVARAAIDFGSGQLKIQMGLVDTDENRLIGEPLFGKLTSLSLTEDVESNGGMFSDKLEQKALAILKDYIDESLKAAAQEGYSSMQVTGIATAVFRKAQNGGDFLQKLEQELGLRFQILSQEDEGKLGFLTAKALYPNVSEASILAWDSGNGSFQMTSKENDDYNVFKGPLGQGTVRVMLSRDVRKGPVLQNHESGNPVLQEEAALLTEKIEELIPSNPEWLQEKLNGETHIITFGDGESIFALSAKAQAQLQGLNENSQGASLSLSDVQMIIDTYLEQGDEAFDAAGVHRKTLTSALQLSAVMRHFGIEKIDYKRSIGNTPGMLLEPELWKEGVFSVFSTP